MQASGKQRFGLGTMIGRPWPCLEFIQTIHSLWNIEEFVLLPALEKSERASSGSIASPYSLGPMLAQRRGEDKGEGCHGELCCMEAG